MKWHKVQYYCTSSRYTFVAYQIPPHHLFLFLEHSTSLFYVLVSQLIRYAKECSIYDDSLTEPDDYTSKKGAVVNQTDRPKSVLNCCVIELFGRDFVLSLCPFGAFWYRGFCHRTESDLFLFPLIQDDVIQCLKSSLKKFYGRYGDLINAYEVTLSRMINDIQDCDWVGSSHKVYLLSTIKAILWHSLLERQSSKQEVVGSSPTMGKNFVILAFFACFAAWQSDYERNHAWLTPSQYPVSIR